MPLLKKILERFNGLRYRQEYLCLAQETFQQPLHIYLFEAGKLIKDISELHAFVGYAPVIFAFCPAAGINDRENIQLVFTKGPLPLLTSPRKADVLARLSMKKIQLQVVPNGTIQYFEGVYGEHQFTSAFRQALGQWHNQLYNQKPGNAYLEGNLFKQVQIAYALPRKICLITTGKEGLYNLFPTDLHGQVDENYYVVSLRHAGKACEQAMAAGKIILSDIQASSYKQVYALGKNHMQPLKEASQFEFSPELSDVFCLPLPKGCVGYKELELQESFLCGIHRLLLFRIVNKKLLTDNPQTLVHVHNVCATWRYKTGLESNFLLR